MSTTLVINPHHDYMEYTWYRSDQCMARSVVVSVGEQWRVTTTYPDGKTNVSTVSEDDADGTLGMAIEVAQREQLITEASDIAVAAVKVAAPGQFFTHHRRIDELLLAKLEAVTPLLPEMAPRLLDELIDLARECPQAERVAISDSAFHITNDVATRTPSLHVEDFPQGTGFQGLVAEAAWQRLCARQQIQPDVVVVIDVSEHTAVTTIRSGKSVVTSMGLTPASGAVMQTAGGDVSADEFAAHLLEQAVSVEDGLLILQQSAGLQGLGGETDWQLLTAGVARRDEVSLKALARFAYSVRAQLSAQIAHVGKVDAVVLTGMALERNDTIRAALLRELDIFSIRLDNERNAALIGGEGNIAANDSVPVHVLKADENSLIAALAAELIAASDN